MSSRRPSIAVLIGLVALLLVAQASVTIAKDQAKILDFDTMAGVQGVFVGPSMPIRGVPGGGLPWALDKGKGVLRANGDLDVKVKGLVLASGANVGSNPVASFRAIVSCLDPATGNAVNVATDAFPATTGPASEGGGNAHIKANVTLSQPCIAPIVFVTSPTGAWFASTGA